MRWNTRPPRWLRSAPSAWSATSFTRTARSIPTPTRRLRRPMRALRSSSRISKTRGRSPRSRSCRPSISIRSGRGTASRDDGAAQMLLELKVPFDVIDPSARLADYRLVILPDTIPARRRTGEAVRPVRRRRRQDHFHRRERHRRRWPRPASGRPHQRRCPNPVLSDLSPRRENAGRGHAADAFRHVRRGANGCGERRRGSGRGHAPLFQSHLRALLVASARAGRYGCRSRSAPALPCTEASPTSPTRFSTCIRRWDSRSTATSFAASSTVCCRIAPWQPIFPRPAAPPSPGRTSKSGTCCTCSMVRRRCAANACRSTAERIGSWK